MLIAIITPSHPRPFTPIEEAAFDTLLDEASTFGLIPCIPATKGAAGGRFHVNFYRPERIPAGWRAFAICEKEAPPCVA